ncbi:hypothetical protein [Clostridium sp. 3-3]|uniref:hypothetical protein n=1 Tax=Clostridium TaxID=1485 RepID=UPI000CDA7F0D|nr:hypothetical protein [Clostridium sp. 3-3]POO87386.1 hypothetical protein C1H59_05880 [Clostridium sp. 3-3]
MSQKLLLNYCQGTLEQGSVLAMEKSTPIVGVMPFKEIKGNAYSFNVVDTLIPTEHRELGQDVDADELQSTKVTKSLMILTNSVKTDRALGVMIDITDIMAEGQHLAMISSGKALEKKVITELESYLSNGEAGEKFTGALTIDLLDDAVDFSEPNIIFVSNGSHRALKKLLKAENESTETIESFGKRCLAYGGVPIHVSHDLGANEILMVRFAEDGVHGVTNSGVKVYEKESGVFHIADTELLYAVVCKTKNSFSKVEFTTTKSK